MASEESPKFNLRRWEEMIGLLSMDVVRPFFDLMGLRFRNIGDFQLVLRQEIVAGRKRATANLNSRQLNPQEIIRAVEGPLGVNAGSHLDWWNRHVFLWDSTLDNVNLRKWTTILLYCSKEPKLWAQLGFPDGIGPDQFRRSRNLDEYQKKQDEVDARALSDWDLHLYALRLYDDNLYENNVNRVPDGPRLYVKPTVRANREYQFWNSVLKTMRLDQRDNLWNEALRIAQIENLLRDPETLSHPSILEIWK